MPAKGEAVVSLLWPDGAIGRVPQERTMRNRAPRGPCPFARQRPRMTQSSLSRHGAGFPMLHFSTERELRPGGIAMDIQDLFGESQVIEGRDLSKSEFEGHVGDRHFVNVNFSKCDFDRSISCRNVTFESCNFSGGKLSGDFTDSAFSDCDFSESTFKGFINEYGFTRCVFTNCCFRKIAWRRPYFKTAEFHDCDFHDAETTRAFVSGFKTYGTHPDPEFFKGAEIKSVFRDGEKLAAF